MSFEAIPKYTCAICFNAAVGIAASSIGPISHPYCKTCLEANREVWHTLIAGLFGCSKGNVVKWVQDCINATCKFYNRTEDQMWTEVQKFEDEYIKDCAKYKGPPPDINYDL